MKLYSFRNVASVDRLLQQYIYDLQKSRLENIVQEQHKKVMVSELSLVYVSCASKFLY